MPERSLRSLAQAERRAVAFRESRVALQYQNQVQRVSYARPEDGFEYHRSLCPGEAFFPFLAPWPDSSRDARRTRHERLRLWVPDTIVYGGADGPLWFFSDRDGYVHSTYRFSDKHVVSKLGNNRYEFDLVAVRKESALKPKDSNPNVVASLGNSLRILNTKELRDVTSTHTGAGSTEAFVLQKFIKSRGTKPCIVRSEYRNEFPTIAWTISNRATFDEPAGGAGGVGEESKAAAAAAAAGSDLVARFCTVPKNLHACNIIPLRGAACQETAAITERLVRYLERMIARIFDVLVVDYIRDDLGQWWFLQVKAFRLRGAQPGRPLPLAEAVRRRLRLDGSAADSAGGGGAPGDPTLAWAAAATAAQAGAEDDAAAGSAKRPASRRAELKVQRLASCRSCMAPYPPSELPYKMTMKMVCDTMDHIRARLPAHQHYAWLGTAQRRHQTTDPAMASVGCESSFMYTPHRVCRLCYELYQQEHRLKLLERRFALAVGVQAAARLRPAGGAAGAAGGGEGEATTTVARRHGHAGQSNDEDAAERLMAMEADQWLGREQQLDLVPVSPRSLPRQLTLCRILVMLHQVHDLPRRFVTPGTRLVMRYRVFTDDELALLGRPLGDDSGSDSDSDGGERRRRGPAQAPVKMLHRRMPSRAPSRVRDVFDSEEDEEDDEEDEEAEIDAGDQPGAGVVLPVNRMRVFHFFAENTPVDAPLSEHSTLADFLTQKRHIVVELLQVPADAVAPDAGGACVVVEDDDDADADDQPQDAADDDGDDNDGDDERAVHRRRRRQRAERARRAAQDDGVALVAAGDVDLRHAVRLGEARLPLKDFRSAVVNKMTHVTTCGCALLRATVGVERTRVVADPQVIAEQGYRFMYQTGIYVPDDSFYTCDPLPAEWASVAPDPATDPGAHRFEMPARLRAPSDSSSDEEDEEDDDHRGRRRKGKDDELLTLRRAPAQQGPSAAEMDAWDSSIWCLTLMLHRTHNLANPQPGDRWYAEYEIFGRACRVTQRARDEHQQPPADDPLERSIAFDSTQRHYVRCSLETLQMFVLKHPWLSVRVRRLGAADESPAALQLDKEREAYACHVNLRALPTQRTIDGTFDFVDDAGHTQPLSGQMYPPYMSLSLYIFRQGPSEKAAGDELPHDMRLLYRKHGVEVLEKKSLD